MHPPSDGERYLVAGRRTDTHLLKAGQGAPLVLGIADHDFDFVATALDALCLFTVERLAHLAREVGERDAEGLGLGRDLELDLLFAGAKGVGDVFDSRVLGERQFELFGCLTQLAEIGAGELEVDRFAGREQ